MKKILINALWISFIFSACDKKSDLNIDGKTTDTRLKEALANYQKTLVEAPYGWVLTEYTSGTAMNGGVTQNGPKAVFTYYMKFDKDNKVTMLSDFNADMATTFKTSVFDIKATQRPTLVFDTYSYIHTPCDPDNSVSNSPFGDGFGWGTDFEFGFADAPEALGDTLHLKGNLNGTTVTLIKATKAEQDVFNSVGFGSMVTYNKILTYFKRFTINNIIVQLTPGIGGKTFNIRYTGHPEIINVAAQYKADQIVFRDPVSIGGVDIKNIVLGSFNSANQTIPAKINGTTDITLTGSNRPVEPDLTAAARFYNAGIGNPWVATAGLHVNGVDDAYQLKNLKYPPGSFYFFIFYPQGVNGGGGRFFDIMSPFMYPLDDGYPFIYNNGIVQTITSRNIIGFFPLDIDGPSGEPALDQNNDILYSGTVPADPESNYGFYVMPMEDGSRYDIVDANTALAWISWKHL